jgi:hypothetical protein
MMFYPIRLFRFRAVIGGIIMPSVSTPRHSERNHEVVAVEESVWPTAHQRYGQRLSPAQPDASTALLRNFVQYDGAYATDNGQEPLFSVPRCFPWNAETPRRLCRHPSTRGEFVGAGDWAAGVVPALTIPLLIGELSQPTGACPQPLGRHPQPLRRRPQPLGRRPQPSGDGLKSWRRWHE